jgi:predicted Ser/Thr protein kinase
MQDLAGATLGNYQVKELLRTGGMAVVYRAIQQPLGREVALKVLASALVDQEGFMQRFETEARTLAHLDHPHILPVFDFGSIDGVTFLTMPLVRGGTLRNLLDEGPLDPSRCWRYINEMADALHHTHEVGVVHRDLKPSNVLIHSDGRSLLSDFGLARVGVTPSALSIYGFTLGTPGYMSPEQAMGRDVDRRADIYALGVLIFEMLTGTMPYSADSPMGLVMATVNAPIPSARARNSALPAELDAVLAKALAKDPAKRHQTAKELLAELASLPMRRTSHVSELAAAVATKLVAAGATDSRPTPVTPMPVYPLVPRAQAQEGRQEDRQEERQEERQEVWQEERQQTGAAQAGVGASVPPPPVEPAMMADAAAVRAMQAALAGLATPGIEPTAVLHAFPPLPRARQEPGWGAPGTPAAGAHGAARDRHFPHATGSTAIAILEQMGLERLQASQALALDSYIAVAMAAARHAAGDQWSDVLAEAGLADPGTDTRKGQSRTTPADQLSRVSEAFEVVFDGEAITRLRNWGRLTTDAWLKARRGGAARQRAIRFVPGQQRKLALMLRHHVEGMDLVRGEHLHTWKQIDQTQFWLAHYDNLYALGRSKRERSCHVWTASFEAMLRWAGLANDWLVEEIECGSVTGTHDCVFAIRVRA